MTELDAVGLGTPTLDELFLLPRYPDEGAESAILAEDYCLQGGGPAGTAMVAVARLGRHAGLIATIGDDDRGRRIRSELREAGVDTSRVVVRPGRRSTLVVVCVHSPTGSRSFLMHSDPDLQLQPQDIDWDYVAAARVLLLASFTPAALAAGRRAKEAGRTVVFDAGGIPKDRDLLKEFLALADVVIGSRDFGRAFSGVAAPAAAAEAVRGAGVPVAVITAGEGGAYVAAAEGSFHQPAFPVDVVDTTGAGDVFHGAFIVGLLENWPVRKVTAFAAAAAALTCTRLGGRAGIPARNELADFLAARGAGIS